MIAYRRGALIDVGVKRLGLDSYRYYRCVTCDTIYPVIPPDGIRCNGYTIGQCPRCSEHPNEHERRARGDYLRHPHAGVAADE